DEDLEDALLRVEAPSDRRLDDADPRPELRQRDLADTAAQDRRAAAARPELRRGDPEQRALARAVRADDAPVLRGADAPVDPVDDRAADAVRGAPDGDVL